MPAALRVALLTTSVEFGGIERVVLNLVEHMDRTVELCPIVFTRTDVRETSFFERLRALDVRYETLMVDSVRPADLIGPVVNFCQARTMFRRRRFDLVHSHGYRADVFGLALSRIARLPIVSTCHGFVGNDQRLRFYNALDVWALRFFTRVITVSSAMKTELIAQRVRADRLDVVANAVAEVPADERARLRASMRSRLGVSDGEFLFGYVGRLSEEKGVDHLLRAASTLAARRDCFRVVVVGDGPRRQELEQLSGRLGIDRHVIFAGFQSETMPWYSAMDAFVLPSLTEGTPMALLEAMAHRLPAVATAVGGVPAVLADRVNGLLVPPADAEALAAAMCEVASDRSLGHRIGERGAETVRERYGVRQWIAGIRQVYEKALGEGARRR
jgi:glycosyltransferase involved in cell wall biosynthesis